LHELRIRIKKLRYAAEFFGDLWPSRRSREYLSELKKLQQLLGWMRDASVAGDLIDELARARRPEVKEAGRLVCSQIAKRAARDRKTLTKRWRSFAKLEPFWRQ
jgi:CHAD domain-containing protein